MLPVEFKSSSSYFLSYSFVNKIVINMSHEKSYAKMAVKKSFITFFEAEE